MQKYDRLKLFYIFIFAALIIVMSKNLFNHKAFAANYSLGNVDINLDTTLSLGTSLRVEERDYDIVGKSNWPDYIRPIGDEHYDAFWNTYPPGSFIVGAPINLPPKTYGNGDGTIPPGAYSTNGDDGNLNFDKNDFISQIAKITSDLDLRLGNGGVFLRGMGFYDYYMMNHYFEKTDITANDDTEAQHGLDLQLLDAYAYFNFSNIPSSLRIGKQVINWGESTYIRHGIAELNPVDAARMRVPGAELKEALIPVLSVLGALDLSATMTLEGFYQFEFQRNHLDGPGTYFSTNDFIGDGGNYVQSGFGQYPDLRHFGDSTSPYRHVIERLDDVEAKDSGQYGIKLSVFADSLNSTEFGFYYINYHSRRPILSGYAHPGLNVPYTRDQITYLDTLGQLPAPAEYLIAADEDKDGWLKGYLEYPEDIKLYGVSFNTNLANGVSLAGEYTYRQKQPLQIDDVELLVELSAPIWYAKDFMEPGRLTVSPVESQVTPLYDPKPGDIVKGYELFDVSQLQLTMSKLFSNVFDAGSIFLLCEVGFIYVHDMPDSDFLRFEAPGTAQSGNPNFNFPFNGIGGGGIWNGELTPEEKNAFGEDFSWGYVLMSKITYSNLFAGIDVSPGFLFTHDVQGTTPSPISQFIENRQSLRFNLNFEYKSQYGFDIGWKGFWGAGTANLLKDRDYVYLNLKLYI